MTDKLSRRELLGRALVAVAATAAASAANAQAAGSAAPAALPHLDATDPSAKALGYVEDATKVDAAKYKTYKAGQECANCLQLQGKAPDAWRPCLLYPKKLVNSKGWCSGYVKKPG